ncbi:MAG: hypothetical protein EZS28_008389 [Streblomastix strix]|uniref:Uncharacterized protein n=1 Tax=Streblomastix strix TaxID=222440 RepID=A0A5J4WNU2_9EUKA|nr:MAG: hypothetical protein EZS28_008389 [Streblomastix strix]
MSIESKKNNINFRLKRDILKRDLNSDVRIISSSKYNLGELMPPALLPYSSSKDDDHLLLKANIADIQDCYSKTEDDALLLLKAEKTELIDSYSNSEDDALLLLKANDTDLSNYVDLTSAQTITGQKYFDITRVFSMSKLGKIDIPILRAGGEDILVRELNDWMAVQNNVAKLVIGENLYVVAKEVTDYWWDGTDLKVLEVELSDMNNVVSTLGVATVGGNAITDILIDGNVLTPAKNKNFVETDYDQSVLFEREEEQDQLQIFKVLQIPNQKMMLYCY